MQRTQNNMDNLLYRTNRREDQKAKQYMQLQNKFLNYKQQFKSLIPEAIPTQLQESNQISTNVLTSDTQNAPNPVQEPPEIIPTTPGQAPTQVTALQSLSTMDTSSSISSPSLPPSFNFDTPSHSRIAVTS